MVIPARIAKVFSLRENARALFVPSPDAIPAVTGLRALSMFWVLQQHVQQGLRPLAATLPGALFLAHPLLSLGWAGNLALETFFVISGYLIGGMLMREREATGALNLRSFYIRRALRILPVYFLAMAVNQWLPSVNKDTIWANLIFINNFVPFQRQFMAHCWSLAVEEQFFAACPLLILLLFWARPERRTLFIGLTVAAACVVAVAVVFTQDIELSMRFPDGNQFWRFMDVVYTKPYARFGSLALGVLVAKLERDGRFTRFLERRPHFATVGMAVAFTAIVYAVRVFPECRGPSGERLVFGAFGVALNGYVFAAAIAFILLLSRTTHPLGRIFNAVLGIRFLHLFAQISFGFYLLHPVCIEPLYALLGFDLMHPWISYVRIAGASFIVSTVVGSTVFLLVERPIMRLRPRAPALPRSAPRNP